MMDRELDLDMDLVREAMEARMERAAERRRAAAWDEPPGYYDDDETIAFDATMLADVVIDGA